MFNEHVSGAVPGILVRGEWIFFSKAWGLGAAFRPQVGPGQRPGRGQGATPPEAPEYSSEFRSKI